MIVLPPNVCGSARSWRCAPTPPKAACAAPAPASAPSAEASGTAAPLCVHVCVGRSVSVGMRVGMCAWVGAVCVCLCERVRVGGWVGACGFCRCVHAPPQAASAAPARSVPLRLCTHSVCDARTMCWGSEELCVRVRPHCTLFLSVYECAQMSRARGSRSPLRRARSTHDAQGVKVEITHPCNMWRIPSASKRSKSYSMGSVTIFVLFFCSFSQPRVFFLLARPSSFA